ncbi:MAG: hypothetical protein JWQ87_5488 [Candidatus Sulfotelmatobacter sp.]|nr:hypothetical protein [Candidatus Sulfotelmatobacter sp.]
MNVQQVIDDLKREAAECQAKVDANTVDAEGHSSKGWAFGVDALEGRIKAYQQILAKEQAGYAAQEEEIQVARKRPHGTAESSSE